MLGFAIVEESTSDGRTVFWLTSRLSPSRAGHTNAVTIRAGDTRGSEKMRSLLADRVVVSNDSIWGMTIGPLDGLLDEADELRRTLTAPARMKLPERPSKPALSEITDVKTRVLETANYVAAAWEFWLATGEKLRSLDDGRERARAKAEGRTTERGEGRCADFPPGFSAYIEPVPLR